MGSWSILSLPQLIICPKDHQWEMLFLIKGFRYISAQTLMPGFSRHLVLVLLFFLARTTFRIYYTSQVTVATENQQKFSCAWRTYWDMTHAYETQ